MARFSRRHLIDIAPARQAQSQAQPDVRNLVSENFTEANEDNEVPEKRTKSSIP
jgi:hypothetical protein